VNVERHEALPIVSDDDIVRVRQRVRDWAVQIGFSLVDQTKLVTAASELARNTLVHGYGGTLLMETVVNDSRRGLRLTFEDRGPGIPDIDLALKDGFTTGTGLGLGLSGARRLSHDFHLTSNPGHGTQVIIGRWK
jgi:serine/threonine-protein kinase RsbT